jgi:hypothetical protein
MLQIGKNVLGCVFMVAGIAMFVLPGQGLLTLLVGFLMVEAAVRPAADQLAIASPSRTGQGIMPAKEERNGRVEGSSARASRGFQAVDGEA